MTHAQFLDEPPQSPALTSYDRAHMKLYLRLLDAETDGADWREAVSVLFGIDPNREPERAQRVHRTHLARARWMTEHGYRHLVRESRH
ncbi:DNA -binding domain-containing protein [Sinorhizobium meliloti]|jgi:hypothetical protein|uniref:DNA -binding domain-containing protein n=1 Tax=Rhizobium meliloti TaxID=382 RepID=UPI000FD74DC1|nr:DUF2285 domain-containing protein [Sinorhizobium meliloti]RVO59174.1 DUF2285 domain-containing protein [Sinorhizobium meliloti]HXG81695.1 DUF2285 domain-containing protein [Sphingomicrobium sp.]